MPNNTQAHSRFTTVSAMLTSAPATNRLPWTTSGALCRTIPELTIPAARSWTPYWPQRRTNELKSCSGVLEAQVGLAAGLWADVGNSEVIHMINAYRQVI